MTATRIPTPIVDRSIRFASDCRRWVAPTSSVAQCLTAPPGASTTCDSPAGAISTKKDQRPRELALATLGGFDVQDGATAPRPADFDYLRVSHPGR
jgi:hypothetical protein